MRSVKQNNECINLRQQLELSASKLSALKAQVTSLAQERSAAVSEVSMCLQYRRTVFAVR